MSDLFNNKVVRRCLRIVRRFLKQVLPVKKHAAISHWVEVRIGGENELIFLSKIGPNKGTALDIGANEGLFSHALSKHYDKVIAFEINPDLSKNLKIFDIPRLEVIEKGLSSKQGELTLYIPVQDGRELVGWASVEKNNLPDAAKVIEKKVDVITLDSLHLTNVTFIKMDVEGHELEVLKGAEQTLRQNRPILLVEVLEESRTAVFAFLASLGYRQTTLKEHIGIEGSEINFIFLPTKL